MNYRVEIKVYNEPNFISNGLRFPTREEAVAYGERKMWSWTAVEAYRVVEDAVVSA